MKPILSLLTLVCLLALTGCKDNTIEQQKALYWRGFVDGFEIRQAMLDGRITTQEQALAEQARRLAAQFP